MRRRAFTLLETLIVAGIIGVLLALIAPAVQRVRASADLMRCAANMNQIGLAANLHHSDRGRLPIAGRGFTKFAAGIPELAFGWPFFLLPYLDHAALYKQSLEALRANDNPVVNPPHVGYATNLRVFSCPADGRMSSPLIDLNGLPTGVWSYAGNGGTGPVRASSVIQNPGLTLSEISDGLSSTLLLGERPPPDTVQSGNWYSQQIDLSIQGYTRDFDTIVVVHPPKVPWDSECFQFPIEYGPGATDRPCDRLHYWSMHPGGGNFLFCDNSVRFISYRGKAILPALATRNGGEFIDSLD